MALNNKDLKTCAELLDRLSDAYYRDTVDNLASLRIIMMEIRYELPYIFIKANTTQYSPVEDL